MYFNWLLMKCNVSLELNLQHCKLLPVHPVPFRVPVHCVLLLYPAYTWLHLSGTYCTFSPLQFSFADEILHTEYALGGQFIKHNCKMFCPFTSMIGGGRRIRNTFKYNAVKYTHFLPTINFKVGLVYSCVCVAINEKLPVSDPDEPADGWGVWV